MPAPTNNDEFLELIQKSGVVEDSRLSAYMEPLRASGGLPPEPSKLAGLLVRDGLLTYFQAEQFLLGKWKRFTIGRYKVLERLGSGGMGQVFLCEHKLMRRRVAVKVLPTAKAEDKSSLDRFYREARAVAALDHPNIVRAYDIDQDDNLHFLVMEWVDGVSLQDLIKRVGPIDAVRAAHYMAQSAIGLQNAHECGLIHRDIKPGNLLVDRQGVVKILDMGLARFFHDNEDNITRQNDESVLGTADYLAPEQALDSHTVDIRADIYSLGATFYFLLTGSPPFAEGTVAQKLIWHQTRQPRPVKSLRPEVPDAMVAVLMTMMAKDANHRFQHPIEVAHALAPWTQQPIAPPTEVEIPPLCAAAQGTSQPSASPSTRPSGPRGSPSTMRTMSNLALPPIPASALASTQTTQTPPAVRPTAAQVGIAPAPALTMPQTPQPVPMNGKAAPVPVAPSTNGTRPVGHDSSAMWESLATEGRGSGSHPTLNRTPRPGPRSDSNRPRGRNRPGLWLWLALAGVTVGVALFGFLLFWFLFSGTTTPKGATGTALVVGRAGPYKNLATAWAAAKSGDRIEVREDITGPVTLEGSARKGVQIVSTAPASVRVNLSPSGPGLALIQIENVEDLKISGFNITSNNNPNLGNAIRIVGNCPGLVLEDVSVQSFSKVGIRFATASGEPARPIRLVNCSLKGTTTNTMPDVAIDFSSSGKDKACQNIEIENCEIRGPFREALVTVNGSLDNVLFKGNKLTGLAPRGLMMKKPSSPCWWNLSLSENTFSELTTSGIDWTFGDLPTPEGRANRMIVERNHFSGVVSLTTSAGEKPFPTLQNDVRGNTHDNRSKEHNAVHLQLQSVPQDKAGQP